MENFEKKEYLNSLFDKYQVLLTEKQISYFKYYFQEDYSLHEIAEIFEVSRNAVYDQLKKVEKYLLSYEEKLHLLEKADQRQKLLNLYKSSLDIKLLDEIGKLDE
ncbi:MAG: hypothetical protein WCR19_06025 [Acholeplasmataceae bacterium]